MTRSLVRATLDGPMRVVGVVPASSDALEAHFCAFVAAKQARLMRFAWVLTLDPGLAEDLVQEALMTCWPKWARVVDGSPEAYVRKAMVNASVNRRRRRRVLEVGSDSLELRDPGLPDETERHDLRAALRDVLTTLPPRQRAALALRFFEDLTEVQAAAAMGCSVGTVKSTTSRALAKLRRDPRLAHLVAESELPS